MRDLAAEPPRVAAEVQEGLLRQEPALVAKNNCVLIVKIYDNLLLNVYFLRVSGLPDITGTQRAAFWIQAPGVFQVNWPFLGAHFQMCRSIRARRRP